MHTEFGWGNCLKSGHFEDQEEAERITLQCILRRQVSGRWNLLRIMTNDGLWYKRCLNCWVLLPQSLHE
jgi:hypothetical protein